MSTVYEARLKTQVLGTDSPQLFEFLDKAVNHSDEPEQRYFEKFSSPEKASQAFWFIRNAKPPERVWSSEYTDHDKQDIARAWLAQSKIDNSVLWELKELDVFLPAVKKLLGSTEIQPNMEKLHAIIGNYPIRSFCNGEFFFTNEYSSNWEFVLDDLVEFLNEHRNTEEKLYTTLLRDDMDMPAVRLYVDNKEIELFSGKYESGGFNKDIICYDRNGFYCGTNEDRSVPGSPTCDYSYLPPTGLKYRIDWLNEVDVLAVKSAVKFYGKKPDFYGNERYVSESDKREQTGELRQAEIAIQNERESEIKRIAALSDEELMQEQKSFTNPFLPCAKMFRVVTQHLLMEEIKKRELEPAPMFLLDPKGDPEIHRNLEQLLHTDDYHEVSDLQREMMINNSTRTSTDG